MKYRISILFLIIFCFDTCSQTYCESIKTESNVPVSNKKIIWKMIGESFENAGVPCGEAETIKIEKMDERKSSFDILQIATEFFRSKNYNVSMNNDTERKVNINIDKLQIVLIKSGENKNLIERKTESEINFTFINNSGEKKVYTGESSFIDTFDKKYLNTLSIQENGVKLVNLTDSSIFTKVKPVAVGVSITLLVWFLYSFRG